MPELAVHANLDELEDIDSVPALIELLSFIRSDQDEVMITHRRILEML